MELDGTAKTTRCILDVGPEEAGVEDDGLGVDLEANLSVHVRFHALVEVVEARLVGRTLTGSTASTTPEKRSTARSAWRAAATFLLLESVAPRVVMDFMGWSSASMLQRYQHVVPALRNEAANRMGSRIFGA